MAIARKKRTLASFVFIGLLCLSSLLLFSAPAEDKRVSIYSVRANYFLPVVDSHGQDYAGLLEALDPLGTVKAKVDGARWRLRYNDINAEFTSGSGRARVRNSDFDLHGPFLLENGRGLVPLISLGPLLSRILGGPVSFHEASRRIFIGDVGVHFTAQIRKQIPPALVMTFSSPVNPMIATEPGKLHMIFNHEPVVAPGSPSLSFGDKTIPSASYQEQDGAAEVTINGSEPLFANFSNGNRTITISAAPQTTASPPAAPVPATAVSSATQGPAGTAAPAPPQVFAVVDASHGGQDSGERISDQISEKDVTLAFARELRQELQNRGVNTLLVRDGDVTLTADQRATLTNIARPRIYICLHASSQGRGVRFYTALLPADGTDKGPFLDWGTAQSGSLPLSELAAANFSTEMQKKRIATRVLTAPLEPLNHLTTAAVAIEIAPPESGVADLTSPAYKQTIAGGIVNGLLSVRDRLEAAR
jgi:N-acetylmuramoyl-L-alanine amidase